MILEDVEEEEEGSDSDLSVPSTPPPSPSPLGGAGYTRRKGSVTGTGLYSALNTMIAGLLHPTPFLNPYAAGG